MAETTTKRGRGRPKKEVLFRQVSVGIYYQSPNYFRPVQVAQFNVSEKTGDFDHTIINSDPTVVKPSLHGLGMCLDSGFPRYESIDSKTGGVREIYRDTSFDDWVNNLDGGSFQLAGHSFTLGDVVIEYETE